MTTLFDLSLDIKLVILNYLDNRSLAYLSQTCTYFGMLARNATSFRKAQVTLIDQLMPELPPFLNYRAGAAVGSIFYMPFINENPVCYSYDLNNDVWSTHKLNLFDMEDIQPQITCTVVIGTKLYLVCGRLLNSYTLSNGMIEIDVTNFNTKMIKDAHGVPPRPRHEHSVDVIYDRYLVVFGGLCYNSVGENDVFVYDTFDNRWFVPPITGHLPHLRFGHASTVNRKNLYIHGGAQLDNDSSYIVYDDLYKLDCDTWTWYKYEHPEVERYLRNQIPTPGSSSRRNHLIATNGHSPYDRFQSYMCNYSNKLIIFGGHSIREDEDDNEILCSYAIDELCVFNTKRNSWTILKAETKHLGRTNYDTEEDDPITVSDMSVAIIPLDSRGIRIFIIAGRNAAEVLRSNRFWNRQSSSLHGSLEGALPSITESFIQKEQEKYSFGDDIQEEEEDEVEEDGVDYGIVVNENHHRHHSMRGINDEEEGRIPPDSNKQVNNEQTFYADIRKPNGSDQSDQIKGLFRAIEPDINDSDMRHCKTRSPLRPSTNSGKSKGRRPSITVIHCAEGGSSETMHKKASSGSSHSSHSSSNDSLGKQGSRHDRRVIPCAILLDLME